MKSKHRSILATVLVLSYATFAYLHDAYHPITPAMMIYPFDPDHGKLADIPVEIRELDGERVSVEGYMIPMDQTDYVTKFAVVPHLWSYGPFPMPPTIQQTMICVPARPIQYHGEVIRAFGQLHVSLQHDDGFLVGLYQIDVDRVEPVTSPKAARWPWAVIAATFALGSLLLLKRWRSHRRFQLAGHCVHCGYDLRATPARCPECGAVAAMSP